MNKKGFTLIELMAVIVVLAILFSFAIFSYSRYLKMSRDKMLKIAVNTVEDSALSAFTECNKGVNNSFCSKYGVLNVGDSANVLVTDLIDNKYLEDVKDPYNRNQKCNVGSYVKVTRKSVTVNGVEDDSNISYDYISCVRCGEKGSQARFAMGKIMKDKGYTNEEIMACTELASSEVNRIN